MISPAPVDAATAGRITGAYLLRFPGAGGPTPAEVTRRGRRFFLDAPPMIETDEIVPLPDGRFISPAIGYHVVFDLAGSAAAAGFTLAYNGAEMPAKRRP